MSSFLKNKNIHIVHYDGKCNAYIETTTIGDFIERQQRDPEIEGFEDFELARSCLFNKIDNDILRLKRFKKRAVKGKS